MVRFEMMKHFGYYITESSEHNSEYMPYWIKSKYPQLIEEFNIPIDEYPRRCVKQIAPGGCSPADVFLKEVGGIQRGNWTGRRLWRRSEQRQTGYD